MQYQYPRYDNLLTASDAVSHLVDRAGAFENDERTERLCFRALQEAVRELPVKHPWSYYKRLLPVVLSGLVEAEVTDETPVGGSKLVLQSPDWPDNVLDGHVSLDGTIVKVIGFDSDSGEATIDYPAGVFTGDSVQWMHRTARIPDAQKVYWVRDAADGSSLTFGLPQDFASRDVLRINLVGRGTHFTLQNSTVIGLTDLIIHPAPVQASVYFVFAFVRPQPLLVYRDEFSSPTVVGDKSFSTTLPVHNWPGAIVRVASHVASGLKRDRLRLGDFNWQSVITDVNVSTGVVTVADDLPDSFGDEDVLVSSLVDIDVPVMQNYVEAAAYAKYTHNHKHEGIGRATEAAFMNLVDARALDNKVDWSGALVNSAMGFMSTYCGSSRLAWLKSGNFWG